MIEVVELKEAWGQPAAPSPAAYSIARAALLQELTAAGSMASAPKRPRWRGGRLSWLMGGTAVTAALAAAVAFAIVPGATRGQSSDRPSTQSYDQLSGQQILLAAATVAQSEPATTGKYWHVKLDAFGSPVEDWTTRDGDGYTMSERYGGVIFAAPRGGFPLGNARTLDQIEQLPADPAALKAWITDSIAHPSPPPPAPAGEPVPPIAPPGIPDAGRIASLLTDLLYAVPAPPAVRAATLRALASLPNVTNLGSKDGGQALRIAFSPPAAEKVPAGATQETLVIDPATATLISETTYGGTTNILAAEWTNTMPKIVTVPHK